MGAKRRQSKNKKKSAPAVSGKLQVNAGTGREEEMLMV